MLQPKCAKHPVSGFRQHTVPPAQDTSPEKIAAQCREHVQRQQRSRALGITGERKHALPSKDEHMKKGSQKGSRCKGSPYPLPPHRWSAARKMLPKEGGSNPIAPDPNFRSSQTRMKCIWSHGASTSSHH